MRRNYIDDLNVLTKQSTRLLESLKKLRNITDVEDRNKKLIDTALASERIAENFREFLIEFSIATKEDMYFQICAMKEYDVRVEGDTTIITMPPLPLKDRDYKAYSYFIDPLICRLSDYTDKHEVQKYDRCILTIKHIFPEDTPLRQLHDFDNMEVKTVIDTIVLFL